MNHNNTKSPSGDDTMSDGTVIQNQARVFATSRLKVDDRPPVLHPLAVDGLVAALRKHQKPHAGSPRGSSNAVTRARRPPLHPPHPVRQMKGGSHASSPPPFQGVPGKPMPVVSGLGRGARISKPPPPRERPISRGFRSNSHLSLARAQTLIGKARVGYRLTKIQDGVFENEPASLLIFRFELTYDERCPIRNVDVDFRLRGVTQEEASQRGTTLGQDPSASPVCWPKEARGPCAKTEIEFVNEWQLEVGYGGFSVKTPRHSSKRCSTRTDSGWRINGNSMEDSKPIPGWHRFQWTVRGHEFNRFPVPRIFDLGMVVTHDGRPFDVDVYVDGDLNLFSDFLRWHDSKPKRFPIEPDKGDGVFDEDMLSAEMVLRYKKRLESWKKDAQR